MGISEMSARLSLATGALIDGFTTIYTLPSAKAAQNFMKTRIDPVVSSSQYLSELVSSTVDNTDVKQFGESYLYLKGCQVDSQAISVPADMLVTDEVDNSNQDVMTLFESRLIHSPYQYKVRLSTPSIPNYGIDAMFRQSRRHKHLCKCNHCNFWFEPDYHDHVKIPGFDHDINSIVKSTFGYKYFKWQDAYLGCPHCGKPVDLSEEYRDWVCENPLDNFVASGYHVSPFSCPSVIKISALVKSSVDYARKQDFYNQRLGKALEDKESTLTDDELRACLIKEYVSGMFPMVMGLDMGSLCACTIAAVLPTGQLIIIHTEMIPLFNVMQRRKELAKKYRIRMCVVDHGPYTETVYRMQQDDKRVFAGVYTRNFKSVDLYKIKEVDKDKESGKEALRQVNIVRDKVFDLIMAELRSGNILKVATLGVEVGESSADDDMWIKHLTDMKRVREFNDDEMVFVWNKTTGEDHYHHSLLYCLIASKMMDVGGNSTPLPAIIGKVKTGKV